MKINVATSNVNGIRAAVRKGVENWWGETLPDVWCLQEVRAPQDIVDTLFTDFARVEQEKNPGTTVNWVNDVCRIKGRAGVGLLSSLPVEAFRVGLPPLTEDVDTGRWVEADVRLPHGLLLTIVSVYVHAGNILDPSKMEQKFRFLHTMTARLRELSDRSDRGEGEALICGDLNVAHTPLDIKNAEANEGNAGFLPAERAFLDQWEDSGQWVDVVRHQVGEVQGPYTWWSQRGRAFTNDVGWRLDYQFATSRFASYSAGFTIDRASDYTTRWSDHAPVTVTYEIPEN